jgi:hypothetical protein
MRAKGRSDHHGQQRHYGRDGGCVRADAAGVCQDAVPGTIACQVISPFR